MGKKVNGQASSEGPRMRDLSMQAQRFHGPTDVERESTNRSRDRALRRRYSMR